ncbi:MAG: AAA family ATPase [Alphaproteobacteria bacterium]
MTTEGQRAVIDFLSDPASYPSAVDRVDRIDTHCSIVFLAGAKAYKLKRAVRLPYLDYGTVELRRRMCEAEVALNRRTAPALYEGFVPVVRDAAGHLRLDGQGEAVDWLVVMRRFAESDALNRMAERGALSEPIVEALADAIAAFHDKAETSREYGGPEAMARVLDSNRQAFAVSDPAILDAAEIERLDAMSRRALDRQAGLLVRRRAGGKVRHCHGDLHLRNIVMLDGHPVPFDGIEFDDALAWIDVLYDLAFLLMDLDHRGLRGLANLVFNRYLAATDEWDGLALMPIFLACRAAIRAHVSATAVSTQADPTRARAFASDAESYLRHAFECLAPKPARLVAIGGLSGTGKSTLARALAPHLGVAPGAVILRSDVLRKTLFGVAPTARLPPEAYLPEINERVYARIHALAHTTVGGGHSAVADAVFARPAERAEIEIVAREHGASFTGLWLEAPLGALEGRIEARQGDASDATVAVLHQQQHYQLGPIGWHRLDASGPPERTLAEARRIIG